MLVDVAAEACCEGRQQAECGPLRQFQFLLQVADPFGPFDGAAGGFQRSGQDGQQRGLAGAVGAGDEDLLAGAGLEIGGSRRPGTLTPRAASTGAPSCAAPPGSPGAAPAGSEASTASPH